jgi:DNA-binding CsgD family transcriptional regulator
MSLKDLRVAAATPSGWVDGGEHAYTPQADAFSARRWAINEVGAAIAHELVEPLTALLLYMHEIRHMHETRRLAETAASTAPISAQRVVEGALRETERICAIMERIGSRFEAPLDSESAVKRGRDAIRWWSRISNGVGEPPATAARISIDCLTPREREVLNRISEGDTNKEGALRLSISPRTFESHRAHIMRKLGAKNAADLLRKVLVEGR